MSAAPATIIPPDEAERLAALRRYDLLDTPPDGAFDRLTALAAHIFDVPIALVSLVDHDRIWFKSRHGLDVTEIARDPGLCASAILQGEPWLVSDAAVDPRTLANPLVAGEFGLRFYAAVPLTTADGYNVGTLCVIDRHPRPVEEDEVAALEHLAAVVMDEMELRLAARREEHRLEQAKSDVVATLSHELRTPLSSVYGAAKTLLSPGVVEDEPMRRRLLEVIAEEAERLTTLVTDIVLADRLESEAVTIIAEPLDPVTLAGRAVEAARPQLPPGLALELDAAEGVPASIEADGGKVRRVLDNLIDNAIRYSPDGGRIRVSVEPAGEGVRFVVRDEGAGVPAGERERIFEKLSRGDPTQSGGVGGAGLGLYICRLLAGHLGGSVGLEPESGSGSAFFFELPPAPGTD
ncbi:MAG TPA: ATP-binding protein [Gaiellaceae bacterium]|nr:ATP-binding protein [Gaiellaceae bacterium]